MWRLRTGTHLETRRTISVSRTQKWNPTADGRFAVQLLGVKWRRCNRVSAQATPLFFGKKRPGLGSSSIRTLKSPRRHIPLVAFADVFPCDASRFCVSNRLFTAPPPSVKVANLLLAISRSPNVGSTTYLHRTPEVELTRCYVEYFTFVNPYCQVRVTWLWFPCLLFPEFNTNVHDLPALRCRI